MSAAERVRAAYAAIAAADRPEVWISLRPENEALAEAAAVDAQVAVFARSLSLARRTVMVMSGPDGRDPLARPRQAAT
jgi:allophanate hydrolase